jgi:isoleucyl-tRNA synthetase
VPHVVAAQHACHGLQIEVAVQQSLGSDTADYDLAQFNAACHCAAIQGLQEGENLAERLGVWPELSSTYVSLRPQCIGTVWGALRRLWDAGRLRQERRVVSVCPRCATPLSTAEATRRAVGVETPVVWVRLPWAGEPNTYLLVWTPVPWTLVGMVALAAHPDTNFALVELPRDQDAPPTRLLLAETASDHTLPGEVQLVRRLRAKSLRGVEYRPPFTFLPSDEGMNRVVLSEDVPLDQGTGLLPVTPSFDALSLALAETHDLPVPQLLDDRGSLEDSVTRWRGLSPLEAEPFLVEDLKARGLLYREETDTHPRALCPHCETPLLTLSRAVWLVETGSSPWIVGRDGAWGAPLPVWICEQCGDELCVAGLDDLAHRTGLAAGQIDPHRPAVDKLTFACPGCGGTMRRTAAVVDADLEAAVLSLITKPQPVPSDIPSAAFQDSPLGVHSERVHQEPGRTAQEIHAKRSLAVGQGGRQSGWLADLTEMSDLLSGAPACEQMVALSDSSSETAWDPERTPPATALRWAAYSRTTPDQAERDTLRPLWRLVADLTTIQTPAASPGRGVHKLLDHWLMARLHQTISTVTDALDACEPQRAAEELAAMVGDLHDWYTPHRPGGGGQVLETLNLLFAPFTPHLSEAIHRKTGGRLTESVHATNWPSADPAWADPELLAQMTQVRQLAALGQAARNQAGILADQPLHQALISFLSKITESDRLVAFNKLLTQVLNVATVEFTPEAVAHVEWHLAIAPGQARSRTTTPAELEAALASLDPGAASDLALQLRDGLSVSLEVMGQAITLLPDEVSRLTITQT